MTDKAVGENHARIPKEIGRFHARVNVELPGSYAHRGHAQRWATQAAELIRTQMPVHAYGLVDDIPADKEYVHVLRIDYTEKSGHSSVHRTLTGAEDRLNERLEAEGLSLSDLRTWGIFYQAIDD